ncbi:hypothetical protein TSTA_126920 [Talaromyces stipitatus ATCC 10500]|uniref:Uncharacterized protein n=1 Tax=Talaromyces stipitatus (strain ATCC 10500 / CBS 375.48 / QM 6759 / NRRL 1006) TaxID=441959 RepID=B8MCT2_TALSN|nr:uncharacterized protein TSTA_126920 [Talaromyces stipitatus ATCC 10500]EED18984.1 hypothetical protein TSTA_126920 [Talaromyces stipitatus ATCC 10500]
MVKEPGQDSAGKALSADAQKDAKQKRPEDSRQKRPEQRLTLDFTDSLKKEFGAAAVHRDGSLDFSVFQKLYENYPEKLFNYRDAMVELIAECNNALARMRELAREGTTSTTSIS